MTTALTLAGYGLLIVGAFGLSPWLGVATIGVVTLVLVTLNQPEPKR